MFLFDSAGLRIEAGLLGCYQYHSFAEQFVRLPSGIVQLDRTFNSGATNRTKANRSTAIIADTVAANKSKEAGGQDLVRTHARLCEDAGSLVPSQGRFCASMYEHAAGLILTGRREPGRGLVERQGIQHIRFP